MQYANIYNELKNINNNNHNLFYNYENINKLPE